MTQLGTVAHTVFIMTWVGNGLYAWPTLVSQLETACLDVISVLRTLFSQHMDWMSPALAGTGVRWTT